VGKSIAYGYLPLEAAKPGAQFETELFGERIKMTVEKGPLFDAKGEHVKS
jgi:glycine cleavage system aminomethyltransferase T